MSFKKISDVVDKLKVVTRFGSSNYSSISRPSSVDKYLKHSEPVAFRQNELRLPTFKNEYLNYIVKKTELKRSSSFNNFTKIPTPITANYAPLKSTRWFYGDQIANQRKLYETKENFKRRFPPNNNNPKPLRNTLHLPLYTYKKFNYSKKKNKTKNIAKMETLFKKIYYGRIINNYFYKVLARDRAKSTEIENNLKREKCVIWPSLYRYKGPPVKENLQRQLEEAPPVHEEAFKNLNSMTAPNKMHFKNVKVNKEKMNIESKEFFKNLNKNTKLRKDIRVKTFAPGIIVKHEHMYQPLYKCKHFFPDNIKMEPNLVQDVNESNELVNLNKIETTKDTASIKNETLTMKDIEFMAKVNERNNMPMNLPPSIKQAETVKNITADGKNTNHGDPVSVDLRNPFVYQKNSTDLNANTIKSNETTKLEQHSHTMIQNQNMPNKIINNAENIKQSEANKTTNFTSNTKKNNEIYKIEQQINTVKQNQNIANFANKPEDIKLSKMMNQIKNEQNLQNNIPTKKQMPPDLKKTNIQRNPKTYQNSMNNTRVAQGGQRNVGTGVGSMIPSNRPLYSSPLGRNFTQFKPSLLGTFTSVSNFSTSTRNLDKRTYTKFTKFLNYLVKLVKINDISNSSKIPPFKKPYPKKNMSGHNWLLSQRVADFEPRTKSTFSKKEAKEEISAVTNRQTHENFSINSSINKELESKVSSSGQQTTGGQPPKPISKELENKKAKKKLILDGPLMWRCEQVLSERKKEIQRGNTKKTKNLVYSTKATCTYEPIYFCKNKTSPEKLNSDYLKNKSKRITHNVQRSKSDYSIYRFPYKESKIDSKSSKNNVDSIHVNYMCTAQNKMRLNSQSNSPIDLESSSNLPNEGSEKVKSIAEKPDEKKDNWFGKTTLRSGHPINSSSQFGYFKPSFPELVLHRNKSEERMPFYHSTPALNVSKSKQTTLPPYNNLKDASKSSIFPESANDVLKTVLEKVSIKSKQKLFNKHPPRLTPNKPFPDAMTITSAGIAFPLKIKLKQKPKINKHQYNSHLNQCATLEMDKEMNSFLLYNRNITDNVITGSQRLSASDKRSGSTIKDSTTFPNIMFPKSKPLYRTITAGIGLPQNIKIPPKPSGSCKTPKKYIKENAPILKENSNHHKPESWKHDYKYNYFLNNQNYLILYEKNNPVLRNKRQTCRVETFAKLGPLLIENQKKNQELLTNAIMTPNDLYHHHCLSAKNSPLSKTTNFITNMNDSKEENQQSSSQLNSIEQSPVNFGPNSSSKQQTTPKVLPFKEESVNTKQLPLSALNVHSEPLSVAKSDATKESNNSDSSAFQINELKDSKLENQKVKLKETSPLIGSKQKHSCNVVDSQPMLLRKNINLLNTYIPLSPFSSKKETQNSHKKKKECDEKHRVHPDLARLLKNGNGIALKTDRNYQNENQNALNKLKYLTQDSVNQKNEEECNLGESETINDSVHTLNEENKCSEQLERDVEFPENNESIGKHNLNVRNMPEQNSLSSNNNKEIILPTKTRNASELINCESKGKDFKVNIGTQTINKLIPVNNGLKLPKLKLNCEKSWYTEQMSLEKKLLLLHISKDKLFVSK